MSSDMIYKIPKNQVEGGIGLCLINSKQILEDTMLLLRRVTSMSTALGLYTYALEEYGKALLLYDEVKKSQTICNIPQKIFRDHEPKFKRALSTLPKDYKTFCEGRRFIIPSTIDENDVVGSHGERIVRTTATTAYYESEEVCVTDFDTRKDAFFVGWDDKKEKWKFEIGIIDTKLEEMIQKLKEKIASLEKEIFGNKIEFMPYKEKEK